MDISIFETDTNLTGVRTLPPFSTGGSDLEAYAPSAFVVSALSFCALVFVFFLTAAKFQERKNRHFSKNRWIDGAIAVALIVGVVGSVASWLPLGDSGPGGKFARSSTLAYYNGDNASVEDSQGTWQHKNHDFVEGKLEDNSHLKKYDIQCEEEEKITDQEKRSVFCGGDVWSPVIATDTRDNLDYKLIPNLRHRKDGSPKDNPLMVSMTVKVQPA